MCHRYLTRLRARTMAKDIIDRVKQRDKSDQELQEILIKDREEHQE